MKVFATILLAANLYIPLGHWVNNPVRDAYEDTFHEDYVLPTGQYCGFVEHNNQTGFFGRVQPYYAYYEMGYTTHLGTWETRGGAERQVAETCDEAITKYATKEAK